MADTLLRDFDKWTNKVLNEIAAVRNGVVDRLQLYTIGITNNPGDGTPVDTGNLQWNWWISTSEIGNYDDVTNRKNSAARWRTVRGQKVLIKGQSRKIYKPTTIARNRTLLRRIPLTSRQSVYLVNHAPYVFDIEYGSHSSKAPQGMLRLAIQRLQNDISEVVREAVASVGTAGFGNLQSYSLGETFDALESQQADSF